MWLHLVPIEREDSVGLSLFIVYISATDLLLPAEKGGQQQKAVKSCIEEVHLCHPFMAN
jgi:hypothetical protein